MLRSRPRTRLIGERLEVRELLAFNMLPEEQYLIELVNAARANPVAAAQQAGVSDLNQGLSPGTISTAPKQPLAPQSQLYQAAVGHSRDMFQRNYFDHVNPEGNGPGQRAAAVGYSYQLLGENLAWGSFGTLALSESVARLHAALIQSPSHRSTLFNPTFDELGVGVISGLPPGGLSGRTYITEEFGQNGGPRYVTGVVYADVVRADNFYTVGEGLAEISIVARASGGQTYSTTTSNTGGYALELPTGTYQVVASGSGLLAEQYTTVTIAGQNIKADFIRSAAPNLAYFIQESFESLLDRTAAPTDVQAWVQTAGYTSLRYVLANFVGSAEYFAKAGSSTALVTSVYRDLLGRTPAAAEVNLWLSSFGSGLSRVGFGQAVVESTEFANLIAANRDKFRTAFSLLPDSEQTYAWTLALNRQGPWIASLYHDTFGRASTESERIAWSKALADGAPRDLVVDLFLRSPERLRNVVAGYYQSILGRAAADGEINSWVGALAAGMTPETVQSHFYGSTEYLARAGGTASAYVASLYDRILGRTATPGEINGWVAGLNSGAVSRTAVAQGFLTSAEYRARLVDAWYRDYLDRPADAAGSNFWTGYLAAGNAQHQALIAILGSPEYRALARTKI